MRLVVMLHKPRSVYSFTLEIIPDRQSRDASKRYYSLIKMIDFGCQMSIG